jgi:hypothetical protein
VSWVVEAVGANGLMAVGLVLLLWPNPHHPQSISSHLASSVASSVAAGAVTLAPTLLSAADHKVGWCWHTSTMHACHDVYCRLLFRACVFVCLL